MENTEITEKPLRKTTRSRAKPKEKVHSQPAPIVAAPVETITKPPRSTEKIEDKVSSIIIVTICVAFLAFVGYQSSVMSNTANTGARPQQSQSIVPQSTTNYDCKKHSGDYTGCVNAQVAGKGCSWYSDCKACIKGSHDGKTYEEICGREK